MIQVYVKMTTRSYVVRVWGKSVKIGHLATTDELEELCTTFFQKSAVCVGYLGSEAPKGRVFGSREQSFLN